MPLTPIYGAALGAKNRVYDHGLLSARRLQQPVISIGNLSTGGSGKTPLVIALAKLLMANGMSVDVLSRGYGRTSDETARVLPTGTADAYGDEPLLIAKAAAAPVFVGRSRFAAGLLAEKSVPLQNYIHLLDDGFQHRQLARDLDVVVLHPSDLQTRLLPAGHLREPLSSLGRAQVVVLREEDEHAAASIPKYLHPDAQIWRIRRTLTCDLPSQRVVAFCGIARPEEFFSGLRGLGIEVAAAVAFPDHHRYSEGDLDTLREKCRKTNAFQLVTTEKDAARLTLSALAQRSDGISLAIAKLESAFLVPAVILATVQGVLDRHVAKG
jgi:tetraacyldisaccharide 4'-kinase